VRPALLIGLLLVAAPAAAIAGGAPAPIFKDGVEITILPLDGAAPGPAGLTQVSLDLEVKTEEAAQRLGFRSMRGVTEVDCRQHANRFVKADSFDQPALKGAPRPRLVTGNWVSPNPDSYMFAVTQRICTAAAPGSAPSVASSAPTAMHAAAVRATPSPRVLAPASAPSGPLPVVTATALPPPAPAPTQMAVAPPAPPPMPQPTAPEHVAMAYASSPPRPAATPAAARPKPAEPAQPSAPAWSAKPDGRGVAQVAAAASAKDAQRVLNQLHGLITPPLTPTVEAAVVQNASIYRASVVGFASLADAKAFCARAASVSKTCWVHWKATKPS
jgi:hypothetical protein